MTRLTTKDGQFAFELPESIRAEPYECESYSGVIFWDQHGNKFDVVMNPHFGPRLIFNLRSGSWNDVPFKEATFGFLPESLRVWRVLA